MIRAIPTEYDGYIFRSRLEARWALFFSLLNIAYRYELEPYENTETGLRYLPDFYLPDNKLWIEVKPYRPSPKEREKADLLIRGSSNSRCFIVEGDPYYPFARFFRHSRWSDGNISISDAEQDAQSGVLYSIDDQGYTTEIVYGILAWGDFFSIQSPDNPDRDIVIPYHVLGSSMAMIPLWPVSFPSISRARMHIEPLIESAMIKARQYRFY